MKDKKELSTTDFFRSISETKINLFEIDPAAEKAFIPYFVIMLLAQFPDCVMVANRANAMMGNMPKRAIYEYLLGAVKRKRRFYKWHRRDEDPKIQVIMDAYNYSERVAREIAHLFDDEKISELKSMLEDINAAETV